jgi:hypothetical protein
VAQRKRRGLSGKLSASVIRDQHRALVPLGLGESRFELRPALERVVPSARLDLDELRGDLQSVRRDERRHRRALGIEAKLRLALPRDRNARIADDLPRHRADLRAAASSGGAMASESVASVMVAA